MELKAKFDVTYMEEAIVFLESLPDKVKVKIAYNISKSRYFMDKELFKKLNDDIWEFRTIYQGLKYRLLAFWDKDTGNLVIATHGFVKKTQKTPESEFFSVLLSQRCYSNTLAFSAISAI
ncbi:MAG: type II toxin-antitoxin system RelE/ParE family toxin [Clostridiales bacterium]|nr:type II toxin-antitoxin system RelE/ParE family toxin [Clostridiales bacterium]